LTAAFPDPLVAEHGRRERLLILQGSQSVYADKTQCRARYE
jgi:hypothetical protein